MPEFYVEVRFIHIAAVLASGGLFLMRGLALFAGAGWSLAAPTRYLSYTIDTVLLAAAIMLMITVRQYPFVQPWLSVKVLLLAVYIVLGIFAFWKRPSRAVRLACWLAALFIYAFIISVAQAHHPLGIFDRLTGS